MRLIYQLISLELDVVYNQRPSYNKTASLRISRDVPIISNLNILLKTFGKFKNQILRSGIIRLDSLQG